MVSFTDYVFVYGTLMRNFLNPVADELAAMSQFVATATVPGKLFDIGDYPGAVFNPTDTSHISGEVLLVVDQRLWPLLDEYEGCTENDPMPHEYQRIVVDATLDTGATIKAKAYHYQWPTEKSVFIPNGNYRYAVS